jgi:two-component system sensor histidine kinase BaeS
MISIRWRILVAFLLVILLTVITSTAFDYWNASKELSDFSTKIRTEDLAEVLSQKYSEDQSWEFLDDILRGYGARIDPEKLSAADAENIDLTEWIPWQVVVRNLNGDILADTFEGLDQTSIDFQLQGEPAVIRDADTGEEVGTVTIAINEDYVTAESRKFLISILYPRLLQGLLTAVVAMLLAAWLSRRITAPVIALTEATEAIVQSGEIHLLPVNSSDELGQMSASFNQMMTSLETQRELRKRLVDDVAHELNTPLSVIRLEAKGLQDGIKPPEEAADQIIEEIDLLSNLVYDLNWLAETDSGALRLEMDSYDFGQFLTAEVERWQLQAQVAEVELDLQPPLTDLRPVRMDANRISQALGNLIENALQHTPHGGRVEIQCKLDGDNLVTSVCDTGAGIPADDLPHIFERFYRADSSRQKESGGRGLGLAIVKKIIEAHQGEVWVESVSGKGSCFYIRLLV